MVLLFILSLGLLGILAARILRVRVIGVIAVVAAVTVWFLWTPATAWPVWRPVVRPAALSLPHHLVRDLQLYEHWAMRAPRPKPGAHASP